jgi:hypothetical protein
MPEPPEIRQLTTSKSGRMWQEFVVRRIADLVRDVRSLLTLEFL